MRKFFPEVLNIVPLSVHERNAWKIWLPHRVTDTDTPRWQEQITDSFVRGKIAEHTHLFPTIEVRRQSHDSGEYGVFGRRKAPTGRKRDDYLGAWALIGRWKEDEEALVKTDQIRVEVRERIGAILRDRRAFVMPILLVIVCLMVYFLQFIPALELNADAAFLMACMVAMIAVVVFMVIVRERKNLRALRHHLQQQ